MMLKPWNKRSEIEAALFNPAFCGELIRRAVLSYNRTTRSGCFPYVMSYLILPFLLNQEICSQFPRTTRTDLISWLCANKHLAATMSAKIRDMKDYTRESLLLYLSLNILYVNDKGEIEEGPQPLARKLNFKRDDVDHLKSRADRLGAWLGKSGDVVTIFSLIGITV